MRLLSLIICLSVGFLSGGSALSEASFQVNYADLAEANRASALFETLSSVEYALSTLADGGRLDIAIYAARDVVGDDYGATQVLLSSEVQGCMTSGAYEPYFDMMETPFYADSLEYPIISRDNGAEVVTACEARGDELLVTCAMDADHARAYLAQQYPFLDADGEDWISLTYIVGRDTLRLHSTRATLHRQDGTALTLYTLAAVGYDVPEPEYVGRIREKAAELEGMKREETRMLTVIIDPATDKERIVSRKNAKGAEFILIYPDGCSRLYLDRACTQPYDAMNDDLSRDLTLYAVPDRP